MLNPGRNLLTNRKIFPVVNFNASKINLAEDTTDAFGKRVYQTPDGAKYPSVTTILSWYSAPAIKKWRAHVGEEAANKIVTQAKRRGTSLHTVCEKYLENNDSCLDKALPTTIDHFKPVKEWLDTNVDAIYCQEAALYSHYLKVAGRVDCVAQINGVPWVIDFKTSIKIKKEERIKNYFMQTSVYCVMFEELTGIPVPNIGIIMVSDDGEFKVFAKKRDDYIHEFIRLKRMYDEKH